ncbi:MAG: HlyD family efflux transporter periplasmic adaptor subunit [Saprospiraceae bacterium]|nr:HlyD family efflux transporter periplasmic adaptor subunit [Saprospiraceae bacterium]MCB9322983.1 HlyD family efflux transporter periplasmic adaptor subunit [Lewinellaceae bacterium]
MASDIEIRSDEVQEILGTPPGWLVRWGTILGLLALLMLGWGSYFYRYPDVVRTDIVVSSKEPPRKLVTEKSGFIDEVLIKNEDTVKASQVLMVLKSKAQFEDVLSLEDQMLSVKNTEDSSLLAFKPPKDLLLGEVQDLFYAFVEKQEALNHSGRSRLEDLSISQLRKQISKAESSIEFEKRRKENLTKEHNLVNERYIREQNLLQEKLSTVARVRQLQEELLSLDRLIQSAESNIKSKEFEISILRKEISTYQTGSEINSSTASSELKETFLKLQRGIEDWRKEFLIVSPMDGVVLITNQTLGKDQYIPNETELAVVLPIKEDGIIGRVKLGLDGSGKVKTGQRVVVKFKSYPFEAFGAVIGEVIYKGKVPHNNSVPAEISFPNGLVTTTNRTIEPSPEMTGTAEIITEKKRFIEWIFENFRKTVM